MLEFLANLFRSDFLPHGVCYRWNSDVVWLHVTSDLLIALAYYFIPFSLIHIVRKRGDLVYPWMFWLFGIFILACGTTHLMNIWVIWKPVYRLDGIVKLITAIASVPTAILLVRLAPMVIAIPSPEQLRVTNRKLEHEISRAYIGRGGGQAASTLNWNSGLKSEHRSCRKPTDSCAKVKRGCKRFWTRRRRSSI